MYPSNWRKPNDKQPKQSRTRSGKPGTPIQRAIAAYRNRSVLTAAQYLASLGADSDTIRRYASQVGKHAKALYAAKFGADPARKGLALVGHHLTRCFAYDRADAEILRQAVADYPKTSFLLNIGA